MDAGSPGGSGAARVSADDLDGVRNRGHSRARRVAAARVLACPRPAGADPCRSRSDRRRLRACRCVLCAVHYYLLFHFESGSVARDIKLWEPTRSRRSSRTHDRPGRPRPARAPAPRFEPAAYLGLPTLAILVPTRFGHVALPGGRFWIAAFVAAFVATLGAGLVVEGIAGSPFPGGLWRRISRCSTDASRFAWGSSSPCRLGDVAFWMAGTKGRVFKRPYILPALAVAALVLSFWHPSAFNLRRPGAIDVLHRAGCTSGASRRDRRSSSTPEGGRPH